VSVGRGHRREEDAIRGGDKAGAGDAVPPERRKIMQANRRRDTGPELAVRSELHRRGFRYRVDHPIRVGEKRPIRPDVVFGRAKVALFVDGCFWHGCPAHGTLPKETNRGYWIEKIAQNKVRDERHRLLLESDGWVVIRVWAHEEPAEVANRVEQEISLRLPSDDQHRRSRR
jgi:DNA mismatch endonuclease (patch repair protein)